MITAAKKKAAGIMYQREVGLCKVIEEGSLWDILYAINQQINSKYRYNSGGSKKVKHFQVHKFSKEYKKE